MRRTLQVLQDPASAGRLCQTARGSEESDGEGDEDAGETGDDGLRLLVQVRIARGCGEEKKLVEGEEEDEELIRGENPDEQRLDEHGSVGPGPLAPLLQQILHTQELQVETGEANVEEGQVAKDLGRVSW